MKRKKPSCRHKWKWFEGYGGSEFDWCEKCGTLVHRWNYGNPRSESFKPKSLEDSTHG